MPSPHVLTFSGMQDEVLERVNDPEGDTYSERAKELLYEGFSSLAIGVKNRDSIHSLIVARQIQCGSGDDIGNPYQIKIVGSDNELDGDSVLQIISISDDLLITSEDATKDLKYIQISIDEAGRMRETDRQPFFNEVFYYRRGDYLVFHPSERMSDQVYTLYYIKGPDEYNDNDDMVKKFSLEFLYKVIDYSVGRIREEQAGQ